MQPEQGALAHRFVANVKFGGIVGRERIAFVMIQAIAVSRDAGHENVAMQVIAGGGAHGRFDMGRGGAAIPIIDVVENDFEVLDPASADFIEREIVAIRHDVLHPPAQVMLRAAMQNRNGMSRFEEFGDQRPADEPRSSDNQAIHAQFDGNTTGIRS